MKTPVAETYSTGGQILKSNAQFNLRIAARPIALRRSMEGGCLAGPTFADIVDLLQLAHDLASDGGPHHFFSKPFRSIALSSVRCV